MGSSNRSNFFLKLIMNIQKNAPSLKSSSSRTLRMKLVEVHGVVFYLVVLKLYFKALNMQ